MKELFLFIKNAVDIVDVIGHYLSLFPAGNYFKGLSPFKYEKTPSFTVTPDKKIFYCFSSHIGGDVIDFVSRMENCSQYQAAMILVQRYGITVDKNILQIEVQDNQERDNYFKIYSYFVSWAQKQLCKFFDCQQYLQTRGIGQDWQNYYNIGYCPSSDYVNDFIEYVQQEGVILLEEILKTNIIQKKMKRYFFTSQERIIFPIQNVLGLYCAYGARTFLEYDSRPKYINSVTSAEFSKKNLLYGLSQAKLKIKETKSVYFVEGYIDVIMMAQAGYQNTVATMGTAMTRYHIEYIKKFVNEVIIMYDGDEAGYHAIIKSLSLFWNESIDVFVVRLPMGEDPASCVQKNILDEAINAKESILQFFLNEKQKDLEDHSLRNIWEVVTDICQLIENVEDEKKRLSIIMKISTELQMSQEYFLTVLNKKKDNKKNNESQSEKMQNRISLIENTAIDLKQQEKSYWYLFFYLTLFFYDKNALTQKSVFLLKNCDICEFKIILEAYEIFFSTQGNHFLDFLKNYHGKLYEHCVKVISMYDFSYRQYEIIFKKIMALSWKQYKTEHPKESYNNFNNSIAKIIEKK